MVPFWSPGERSPSAGTSDPAARYSKEGPWDCVVIGRSDKLIAIDPARIGPPGELPWSTRCRVGPRGALPGVASGPAAPRRPRPGLPDDPASRASDYVNDRLAGIARRRSGHGGARTDGRECPLWRGRMRAVGALWDSRFEAGDGVMSGTHGPRFGLVLIALGLLALAF